MFTDNYSEIPIVYYEYIHAKNHKFINLCGASSDKSNKYTNYKSIIISIIKVFTYRMQMLHTFPWHTKYIDLRAFFVMLHALTLSTKHLKRDIQSVFYNTV